MYANRSTLRGCGLVVAAIVVGASWSSAVAGPRRPGLTAGIVAGGGAARAGDDRGPSILFGADLGWLVGEDGRLGIEAELFGAQAWVGGVHRIDGVLLAGLRVWPIDRASFTLGLGAASANTDSDTFVAAGAAAGATVGVDVVRWRRTALALRAVAFGGDFDDRTVVHVGLTLGVEWYAVPTPPPP